MSPYPVHSVSEPLVTNTRSLADMSMRCSPPSLSRHRMPRAILRWAVISRSTS